MKTLTVLMALATATVAQAGLSLLTNGDAELGTLAGWNTSWTTQIAATSSLVQSTGTVTPYAGNYFFSFAQASARATTQSPPVTIDMYQTGALPAGPGLTLSGWVQTETYVGNTDHGEAVLSIYDGSNNQLTSVSSGLLSSANLSWSYFDVFIDLTPWPTATSWRVDLYGTVNSTTYVNTFWDNLSLQVVPAPAAAPLGLAGLGLIAALRRRLA